MDKNLFKVENTGDNLDAEITKPFCCDLLSVAMGKAPAGSCWVTVMANMNTLAVAVLTEVACIVLAEGMKLDDTCLQKAVQQAQQEFNEKSANMSDEEKQAYYHDYYCEYVKPRKACEHHDGLAYHHTEHSAVIQRHAVVVIDRHVPEILIYHAFIDKPSRIDQRYHQKNDQQQNCRFYAYMYSLSHKQQNAVYYKIIRQYICGKSKQTFEKVRQRHPYCSCRRSLERYDEENTYSDQNDGYYLIPHSAVDPPFICLRSLLPAGSRCL